MNKYYRNVSKKIIPIFNGMKTIYIKPGQSKMLPKCVDVLFHEKQGSLRRDKTSRDMKVRLISKLEKKKVEEVKKIEKKKKSKK